jgi:2-phosphosulfolactate phosphatase
MRQVRIDCGRPPALDPGETVVVIDVIRSTTTASTAVASGRRCFPVPSVEAAFERGATLEEALLVGEVGGVRPDGFELTNSPAEVARRSDVWRPMVLLSSSGTPLLDAVRHCDDIYIACLRNYRAVARTLVKQHSRVALLGAPTHGQFREEDQMCCGLIAAELVQAGYRLADTRTKEVVARWSDAPHDAFLVSASVRYLRRSGQMEDLQFILEHIDDLDRPLVCRAGEVIAA